MEPERGGRRWPGRLLIWVFGGVYTFVLLEFDPLDGAETWIIIAVGLPVILGPELIARFLSGGRVDHIDDQGAELEQSEDTDDEEAQREAWRREWWDQYKDR